jgi:predicted MFS family arabinose efflux permease
MNSPPRNERSIVLLIAAVQFVNILDFVMVMPLGPDFAKSLGISTSHIGYLGGSYTGAAAIAGILGAGFLDKFDRRKALAVAMLGLGVGTLFGGLAQGLWSLMIARIIAGSFGGPATAIALAIVSDTVPIKRRGKALGTVMTAFSVASILGVPTGLELARRLGWRAPFFGVAALSAVITTFVITTLPPIIAHREIQKQDTRSGKLIDHLTVTSLTGTALIMISVFTIIPNISAFVQHNLGFPRERLGLLYLLGGSVSFLLTHRIGILVDRYGATVLIAAGTCLFSTAMFFGFIHPVSVNWLLVVFPLLMLAGSARGVPMNTLSSRVPKPDQRASFMSTQSAVQHGASALGALLSSAILTSDSTGKLQGISVIATFSIAIALFVPLVAHRVENSVRRRESQEQS